MEPVKVLIMCQRKKSYDYSVSKHRELSHSTEVDITVKRIEQYLYNYYGTRNIMIEYMIEYKSQKDDMYEAEYKFWFDPSSNNTSIRLKSYEFISSHSCYYDMIMLQTCPLMHFTQNFRYLPWLLKSNGVLSIKAFSPYDKDHIIDVKNKLSFIHNDLIKYFDLDDIDIYKPINKEE